MPANQGSPNAPSSASDLHSEGRLPGELAEVRDEDRGVEAAGEARRLGRLVVGTVAVAIAVVVVIAAGSADQSRQHDQIRARCFIAGGPAEMCD